LLPLALTLWLSACHKWVEVEPPQLALQEQADKPVEVRQELRLHLEPDGKTFEGNPIIIDADSVVLVRSKGPITVSTVDITRVDVKQGDAAASLALGAGVILGGMLAAMVIALAVTGGEWD
jgi:hypothetical protein